ncbi:MAG: hypothetical protein AAGF26_09605 [Cyanobacteria bacterium P01_G01_bin.49]
MYAIGSSYLIRQSPGAERIGGVTVRISPRTGSMGTLKAIATDWITEELIDDDIKFLIEGATEGIKRFAAENSFNLDDWDITVTKFAYHPVDSKQRTVQIAAYNAIAVALASWRSLYVQPAES